VVIGVALTNNYLDTPSSSMYLDTCTFGMGVYMARRCPCCSMSSHAARCGPPRCMSSNQLCMCIQYQAPWCICRAYIR
jgi:hypothetical protein